MPVEQTDADVLMTLREKVVKILKLVPSDDPLHVTIADHLSSIDFAAPQAARFWVQEVAASLCNSIGSCRDGWKGEVFNIWTKE